MVSQIEQRGEQPRRSNDADQKTGESYSMPIDQDLSRLPDEIRATCRACVSRVMALETTIQNGLTGKVTDIDKRLEHLETLVGEVKFLLRFLLGFAPFMAGVVVMLDRLGLI